MNLKKFAGIMPYVLGILILILVIVIIFAKLSDEVRNPEKNAQKTEQTDAGSSTETGDEAVGKGANQGTADGEENNVPDPKGGEEIVATGGEGAEVPSGEAEPQPVEDPEPTKAEEPEPTPITDLTYGLKFEEKNDFVDTKPGVNLRLGCSTDTERVEFLKDSTRLARTGYNSEWTRVIFNDQECYIATFLIVGEVPTFDYATPTPAPTEGVEKQETVSQDDFYYRTVYGDEAGKIVCIDAGHQASGNSDTEPLGPGSTELKAKVSSGTKGKFTGLAEYKLTLTVAYKLKAELISRGYRVIMTRESSEVNLSNIDRAEIANRNGADIMVRIHANSSDSADVEGAMTICPTSDNPYTTDIYNKSYRLSSCVLNNVLLQTGAKSRGIWDTDSMTGINWSKIPVTYVEMGFMSNEKEDRLLSEDYYQNLIVGGIADGIDEYFTK